MDEAPPKVHRVRDAAMMRFSEHNLGPLAARALLFLVNLAKTLATFELCPALETAGSFQHALTCLGFQGGEGCSVLLLYLSFHPFSSFDGYQCLSPFGRSTNL